MRKTKIICTLGPNANDEKMMREFIRQGMDVARFNFSHGDHAEQKERMDMLKRLREEENRPVAILLDTKGPEIRTGTLKDGLAVNLVQGESITLTTEDVEGTAQKVYITYDMLYSEVRQGSKILIDDGLIELTVEKIVGSDIVCRIDNGGSLGERKGINVPNVPIKLPAITDKDKADIAFGVEQDIDFIAASFVRNADAILEIKALLKSLNAPYIPVIAKIENAEGIKNIDEIIRAADGIMVARGDLGVELPPEEVPYIQKTIIQKCNENYITVITATQMLDSMIRNPRPTRAEVTDVATAVYDGTDAVMLSGETASGKYPLEAIKMMEHIIENTEKHLDYKAILTSYETRKMRDVESAIGHATVSSAMGLGAKCILTPTVSGATSRVVSKFKPKAPIIGVSPNESALRRMMIQWGVTPTKSLVFSTTEDICDGAVDLAKAKNFAKSGDIVVLTAGIPSPNVRKEQSGVSNMIQITEVK
ncbi:MAG: pyruvate kinase [Lachnospiraceae bacterium]|jgi:pyruvate kinase|nr:pyruvate kinase [Lachnospiraceae bacterium]